MGSGMVHPRILAGVGYDTETSTGFAFGLGRDGADMMKYVIDSIRLVYSNPTP